MMQIKYPRLHFNWNGRDYDAAIELVKSYLKIAVYISPLAWWKAYEIIKEFIR